MPRHTEPSVNTALGRILQRMMRSCSVRSENVRAILGHPGLQPDILITATGRAPVILEAEFEPAHGVEAEALGRLGLKATEDRRDIEAVIALRYPDDIASSDNIDAALVGVKLRYCVFTGNAMSMIVFLNRDGWEARWPILPTSHGWCPCRRARLTTLLGFLRRV